MSAVTPAVAAGITLDLVYLARLREAFGCRGEAVTLPMAEGEATVADVVAALVARGGAYAHELGVGRAIRIAVNHALVAPDHRVRSGDEIAFLPPVTGG